MSSKRSEGIGTDAEIVPFGTTSTGETVRLITLRLGGLTAKLSTYGATLTSLVTLDCRGELAETVLGFGVHEGYAACPYYFGCTVGRYANRIAGGAFPLGDGVVQLPNRNDRGNTLHGGLEGWDKRVWTVQDASRTACTLVLHSPDGDEGFPLALDATVRFSLEHGGRFVVEYVAALASDAEEAAGHELSAADAAAAEAGTVCSLTNHAYFNLADGGVREANIHRHTVRIFADSFLPNDGNCLPTGEVRAVSGPMDLREPTPIGRGIGDADGGIGYDHNYCLRNDEGGLDARGLRRAAWLRSDATGLEMNVLTTEPGIQICTADFLKGEQNGHGGATYGACAGVCLETQKFPDAPNHPEWPSAAVRKGSPLVSTTVYALSASAVSTEGRA